MLEKFRANVLNILIYWLVIAITNVSKFQFNQDRGPTWTPASADVSLDQAIVIYHDT